ncbi:S-layer homology domain-containing protein [Paenibacillus sp. NPDC058071]|uniref:S-layer homology domain-containing protein n=1 Tax=Paenibacillus sp. NPDC058071 TaxID=3346326 RepID=UPI0036DD0118
MKAKRWIAALAIGAAISLTGALTAGAGPSSADFTDLKDLDAATKAKFDALIAAGIINGVSDVNFGLQEEMNRAQFAKVAALIFDLKSDQPPAASSFSDVSADHYALPYIEALKKEGIVDGVGAGKFDPSGTVTKEQLATMLVRGLGQQPAAAPVNDPTVSDWAKGYVALALQLKLVTTGDNGSFNGKSNATRELLVLSAFEAAQVKGSLPTSSPSPSPTPTPTPSPTPAPATSWTSSPSQPTPEPTPTPTPPVETQVPPTETPDVTDQPTDEPTETPYETPGPAETPYVTDEPTNQPTDNPGPTETPTPTPIIIPPTPFPPVGLPSFIPSPPPTFPDIP